MSELHGIVQNGVIIPDGTTSLPEGTLVRIIVADEQQRQSFGERFAKFKGAANNLPADLAEQHEHYRLGTAKR